MFVTLPIQMGNASCGLPQFFCLPWNMHSKHNKIRLLCTLEEGCCSLHFPNIKMLIPSMPIMTPSTNGFTFDYT